jgi:hypothetical protein
MREIVLNLTRGLLPPVKWALPTLFGHSHIEALWEVRVYDSLNRKVLITVALTAGVLAAFTMFLLLPHQGTPSISRRTPQSPTRSLRETLCSSGTSVVPTCGLRSGGQPTTSALTSTTHSATNSSVSYPYATPQNERVLASWLAVSSSRDRFWLETSLQPDRCAAPSVAAAKYVPRVDLRDPSSADWLGSPRVVYFQPETH